MTINTKVVIECGTCAVIDEDLDVQIGGLLVVGKLHIPARKRVRILTPHVFVEGILRIDPPDSVVPSNYGVDIILTGVEDQIFSFENQPPVLGLPPQENFGSKPFAIVGGKLDIRGMSEECPTWSKLLDVRRADGVVKQIKVSPASFDCWGEGAEILVTSHWHCYTCHHQRKISSIDAQGWISLDQEIDDTTSEADHHDLAVEVALLSRHIRFRGEKSLASEKDGNVKAGAHTIIFRTPAPQIQLIQGVLFLNFGQAGRAGRYPVHFHMSRDVTGSRWAKNLVRDSFQRCYVVHGTHNLLVEDNIAYNTHGHCFLLEDSVETGNTFKRNLVAATEFPLAPLSIGGRPDESDKDPSSFWITNPKNNFIDNVAAGCRHNGWWFELTNHVRGMSASLPEANKLNPTVLPLGIYSGNIAHSNNGVGMKTYRGAKYQGPGSRQAMHGWKLYRNRFTGLFWTFNMIDLMNSYLADNINQPSVNFGRSGSSRLVDTTIIGDTALMMKQFKKFPSPYNKYHCGSHGRVGLWVQGGPLSFINTTFSNFNSFNGCEAAAIGLEYNSGGRWSLEQSFRETTLRNVQSAFMDFCRLTMGGKKWDDWLHSEVGIHDEDGTITSRESGAYLTAYPYFWNKTEKVPSGSELCDTSNGRIICNTGTLPIWSPECYSAQEVAPCSAVCPVACYEDVEVWVSMNSPAGMRMRVTNVKSGVFVDYNEQRPLSHAILYRIFAPKLPKAEMYEFKFFSEGKPIWPHSIFKIDKKGSCGDNFAEIKVYEPPVICGNAIINGDAETGNQDGWNKSTNTYMSNDTPRGSSYSFKLARRFQQSLDPRCIRGRQTLKFQADVKMIGIPCQNRGIAVMVGGIEIKKSDWEINKWFIWKHTFDIDSGSNGGNGIRFSTPFSWCVDLRMLLDNVSLRIEGQTFTPSAGLSPSPTDLPSSVPSLTAPCVNLKKGKCRKECVFTKKPKKIKVCFAKKETLEHDCSQHTARVSCKEIAVCKFANGKCFHSCDDLKKRKCIQAQFCKLVKIKNPCLGCQLVATCGSRR